MNEDQPTTEKESPPSISRFITIIRPEFMAFCKDACRAAALNHLLFRIAYKCKDQPKEQIQAGDVLWYAKTELLTSEMSDAWGVCKVRKEVNALLAMNLIGRKSNPTWGVDRTKHFFFGAEQCQVFLDLCKENEICVVHLDLPVEVKHLIYLSVANDTSIKCTCEKQDCEQANDKSIACIQSIHQMHSINLSPANDISIEAITKNTTKRSTEDNNEEESTYPAGESQSDNPGSSEPTHALSSQDLSQQVDEKIEDIEELRRKSGALSQDVAAKSDDYEKGHTDDNDTHSHSGTTGATQRLRVGSGVGHSNAAANERDVRATQQSALLMARAPQRGAKVYTAPLFETKPARPQLTEEGKNVLEWFQTIQACKVRRTNENINAANGLGEEDGMSFENLKAVIEHWQADAWVSKNKIPIDLQTLENPAGRLTFAKAMLVIRTKPKPTSERKTALPSYAHMSDEEYQAHLRR